MREMGIVHVFPQQSEHLKHSFLPLTTLHINNVAAQQQHWEYKPCYEFNQLTVASLLSNVLYHYDAFNEVRTFYLRTNSLRAICAVTTTAPNPPSRTCFQPSSRCAIILIRLGCRSPKAARLSSPFPYLSAMFLFSVGTFSSSAWQRPDSLKAAQKMRSPDVVLRTGANLY
jgi:hypothetical protein